MKGALGNSGSGSHHDRTIAPQDDGSISESDSTHISSTPLSGPLPSGASERVPNLAGDEDRTHSGSDPSPTESFRLPQDKQSDSKSSVFVGTDEQTIVSQRPVAAPEEFYSAMPLGELAGLLEGKQLDHFSVERMIGGGGMGAVFRGVDVRLDRTVAIKVIPGSKRDAETFRRFRQEAQAAARLDHPNIARVYYVGEAERWNYIVFEFIDGVNIRDLVTMEGPLSVDEAVFYTRQIAEALSHAHERDVVHRDIKPSNILVTSAGTAKVVDMGLARNTGLEQSTNDATASGVTLGTFDYISPEQARNPRDADVRSDLYSLGCSLFFMLTGKPPFSEGTVLQKLLKHGSVPPPDPRGWREDLSDQLYAILMKLMAKQPNERYQTPADLINDLLLLAEVEDLPRSQMPGSVMFTPSVAQRSLMETHLPWMVAFAFLLGSTLWLQAILPISQRVSLEDIRDISSASYATEIDGADGSITEDAAAGADSTGQTADRDPSELVLVVSPFRHADVEPERWVKSLNEAAERLVSGTSAVIELRGTHVLDTPIQFSSASVTLRGTDLAPTRIEVSPALLEDAGNWQGLFDIDASTVQVEGIDFKIPGARKPLDVTRGLFRLTGRSSLDVRDCDFTLHKGTGEQFVVIVDEQSNESLLDETLERVALPIGDFRDVEISFQGCFLRGYGSAICLHADLAESNQFVASFSQTLVAMSNYVLAVGQTQDMLGQSVERNVTLICESSTFSTRSGFVRIRYGELADPLLSLSRTSLNCVYESERGNPHLSIVGLGSESQANLNRFFLEGSKNAYDEKIETLCTCYDRENTPTFSFSLSSADRDRWFDERVNDRQVRWSSVREEDIDLSEVSRSDFSVQKLRVFPGFERETPATTF